MPAATPNEFMAHFQGIWDAKLTGINPDDTMSDTLYVEMLEETLEGLKTIAPSKGIPDVKIKKTC